MVSGSVSSITNENLAKEILQLDETTSWIDDVNAKRLKTFSNLALQTVGMLRMSVEDNNWIANPVHIKVDIVQYWGDRFLTNWTFSSRIQANANNQSGRPRTMCNQTKGSLRFLGSHLMNLYVQITSFHLSQKIHSN